MELSLPENTIFFKELFIEDNSSVYKQKKPIWRA